MKDRFIMNQRSGCSLPVTCLTEIYFCIGTLWRNAFQAAVPQLATGGTAWYCGKSQVLLCVLLVRRLRGPLAKGSSAQYSPLGSVVVQLHQVVCEVMSVFSLVLNYYNLTYYCLFAKWC